MISQFSGRIPRLRSSASASPARMPVTTTSSASSIVTTTPQRMSGRYLSMTLPLKNVSTKRAQPDMRSLTRGGSMPLDLADEAARALVSRALEDRGGRAFLHDRARVHEQDAVRGVAGEAHLVADDDHGHPALAQRAHDLEHRAAQPRSDRAGRLGQ